jgi:predicted nucleotidyltransferase
MKPHHESAIRKLADHFSNEEGYLAVIVGGSVAKGVETEFADIDIMLVVTDELYEKRREENALFYFSTEFCDYPGGYVDGKIVNLPYLQAAAERGNEVTRAAFEGAFAAYSTIPDLDDLLSRIPVYQADEQREKIRCFYAQFECAYWYFGEGIRRDDKYLRNHALSSLILYGGRLILAHNEILYPYHKLFLTALNGASKKPENLMGLIDELLEEPSADNAKAFHDAVAGFRQWNEPPELWSVRFMKDTELAWMENKAYIGDI